MKTRMSTAALVAVLAWFTSSLAFAALSTGDSTSRLMQLSGLTRQINEYPALIKTGFVEGLQQGAAIPDDVALQMLDSIDVSIQPAVILRSISDSVAAATTEEEVQELLRWYVTDTGREITALEEAATTPQAYEEMIAEAQALAANTARVESAMRMDDLLGATDMSLAMQKSTSFAVYGAIMQAMAPDQPLDVSGFEAQWQANEPQIRAQMQQVIVLSFVYTYKPADDASLAAYEDFLATPASLKFNRAVIEGMRIGMEEAVAKWAAAIAGILVDTQPAPEPTSGS